MLELTRNVTNFLHIFVQKHFYISFKISLHFVNSNKNMNLNNYIKCVNTINSRYEILYYKKLFTLSLQFCITKWLFRM